MSPNTQPAALTKGKPSYYALGRLKSGEMNKTEQRHAAWLEGLRIAGEVAWWAFEPANLRLADKCYYRIDFLVMRRDGTLEVHETKGGYMTDDGLVKIKAAAEKFPFRFLMYQYKKAGPEVREF